MATARLRRQDSGARPRGGGISGASRGLEGAARQTRGEAVNTRFQAGILGDVGEGLFQIGAQQREREANEAALSHVFQREAVTREIVVDGQKRVVREPDAAVSPSLPDSSSISIFDQRYRSAMQARYLADAEVTSRGTLSKLAAEYQDAPDKFGAAAEGYMKSLAKTEDPTHVGVVIDSTRRIASGLMAGLVNRKASKDYSLAKQGWATHLEMLGKDVLTASSAGSDGRLVVEVDGQTRMVADPQLTGSVRQIMQQWQAGIDAGFTTPEQRDAYVVEMRQKIGIAQVMHKMGSMGTGIGSDAARAKMVTELANGTLPMSVPQIDSAGGVHFLNVNASQIIPDEERAAMAGSLNSYANALDAARRGREALDNRIDSDRIKTMTAALSMSILNGSHIDMERVNQAVQSMRTPAGALAGMALVQNIQTAEENQDLRARQIGMNIARREELWAWMQTPEGAEELENIGAVGQQIITSQGFSGALSKELAYGVQLMSKVKDDYDRANRAGANMIESYVAFDARNREPPSAKNWDSKATAVADNFVSMEWMRRGMVNDPNAIGPETYLENPVVASEILDMSRAAPPQTFLDALTGSVLAFSNGEQGTNIEAAVALFREAREKPHYKLHLKGEKGIPPKIYNILAAISEKAAISGMSIDSPQMQTMVTDYMAGTKTPDIDSVSAEMRQDVTDEVTSVLTDGHLLGNNLPDPRLVRTGANEVLRALPLFDGDIGDATRHVLGGTSHLLANSEWAASPIAWNGGPVQQQAQFGGAFGGGAGMWVMRSPEAVYRDMGVDTEDFVEWTQPLLDQAKERTGETHVLGNNVFLKPGRGGDRQYSLVYLDRDRTMNYLLDERGDAVTINFDSFVELKRNRTTDEIESDSRKAADRQRILRPEQPQGPSTYVSDLFPPVN